MPINKNEVSYEFKIDFNKYDAKLTKSDKDEIKTLVGEHLLNNILEKVSDSISPVTGKRFKMLSPGYAEKEKNGDRNSNLELYGNMLNALEYKPSKSGIKIGIFDKEETPKAFNHNTGDTLPKRQFIPEKDQNFTKVVQKGIDEIIKDYIDEKI